MLPAPRPVDVGQPAGAVAAQTDSRSVASTACTASTWRSPSGPSTRATSDRTASGCWGTTSCQAVRRPGGRVRRIGDGEPPARGVAVRHQPQPAVAGDPRRGLRVHADLEVAQLAVPGEVGDPHVVARRGAGRPGDDQPAAVAAGVHAEVGGGVAALAVDEHVVVGRRRRPGGARPGGGTAPRRRAPGPARGGGRRTARRRRAARRRGSSGSGRSARRRPRRWRRRGRRGWTPRRRPWRAGRPAGRPPTTADQASSVVVPAGSSAIGSTSTRCGAVGLADAQHRVLLARVAAGGEGARRRARPGRRRRRRAPAARAGRRTPARMRQRAEHLGGERRPGPRSTPGSADRRRPRASGRGRRRGVRAGPRRGRAGGRRGSASHPR